MKDRLEDYIKENKREFDMLDVPAGLWGKIESKLEQSEPVVKKQVRLIKLSLVLKAASCVLIVLCASAWFIQFQKQESTDLSNISPELASQQIHYASLIEEKRSAIKQIEKEEPQLYQEFSAEIIKMENGYQRLKRDLPHSPNQEETVKAMIMNLQIQTELLNQQLRIIQQVNKVKKEKSNDAQQI